MIDNEKANKMLLIEEAIEKLRYFSRLYGIQSLFIVGGYCRSLYLNSLWDVNDIDVASAFPDLAIQLGGLFASEIAQKPPDIYRESGTLKVEYETEEFGSINIEFQSKSVNGYMYNSEVTDFLRKNKVEDVPLLHNIYGRDFTIN